MVSFHVYVFQSLKYNTILNLVLQDCSGEIISPAEGTTYYFTPGSTKRLTWKFTCDDISNCVKGRNWLFTPMDASSDEKRILASITNNDTSTPFSPTGLSFEIEKPSTLLLKNVNRSYSGTYEFSVMAGSMNYSRVTVFITGIRFINLYEVVSFNSPFQTFVHSNFGSLICTWY
jgi:hypothetical protein